MIETYPLDAR